ncbi:MAG TPA: hypothetical protein VLH56_11365 [Dissulfurispiraceae bacterium]|nr:hypothetical protein [Dissulfurispiraceae bacterium]
MIIRIEIELDSGTLKFATEAPVHVADDTSYLKKILLTSEISRSGNFGDGWRVGNFSFSLDNAALGYQSSADIWYGRPVIVYVYEETLDGETWKLTERDRWTGAVSSRSTAPGELRITAAENHGRLGDILPRYTISSAEYPAASDSALGQPIQTLTGSYTLAGGAVVAWAVGDGRYLVAQNSIVSVHGVFDPSGGGVSIPAADWQLIFDADGRSYIRYIPAEGQAPEYLYCNVVGTTSENPVDALKATLDAALGTDVFFTGAAAVKSEMTTRGYLASINAGMGDTVGDMVDEFCRNFDCFAVLGTDGKLSLGMVSATPVETFDDDNIIDAQESEDPGAMANDVRFAWAYDFAKNQYNNEDHYQHTDSIDDYGRHVREWDYFLTRDRSTAVDVTRRKVRQLRELPRRLELTVWFTEQTAVDIGDVISVEHEGLLRSGSWNYLVHGKRINYASNTVILECMSYLSGMDYIIEVTRNYDGGTINPFGMQVVSAGSDLTIDVTTDDYQSIEYFWVDYTTRVEGVTKYTFGAIDADHTFMVVFKTDRFLIVASDDGNGVIDPKGNVYVEAGADQTFTFTPASGKTFSHWIVDGAQDATYPYVFEDVDAPHTIVGYSTDVVYQYVTVTIIKTGSGTITPGAYNGNVTVNIQLNSPVLLLFSPAVTSLTRDSVDVTSGNEAGYYIDKLTANTTFEVNFA